MVAPTPGPVLVVDVPHGERRVAGIALGKLRRDADGDKPRTVRPYREGVGVGEAEPRRWRCRGRSENDANAGPMEALQCGVQPVETVAALAGLNPGPGEDPDGRGVDARFVH